MSPTQLSKLEAVMRIVLTFYEAFNQHDGDSLLKLLSDDCIIEDISPAPEGTIYKGKVAISLFWEKIFRESPQAHFEIEEIFGLGARCVVRWSYNSLSTDGRKTHFRGADIFKVTNGLICEQLSYVKC
ncbi:nuclear transport factor 2 family protein [candidate division KSB1 bacterium]|nr:nuclear transport factor 2 family protein [candidate division KSB1 bacterium]